jgi:hypothetical protein
MVLFYEVYIWLGCLGVEYGPELLGVYMSPVHACDD